MNCGLYIQWNIILSKKEGKLVTYYNTGESGGHYAQWNNPVTKRPAVYDATCGFRYRGIQSTVVALLSTVSLCAVSVTCCQPWSKNIKWKILKKIHNSWGLNYVPFWVAWWHLRQSHFIPLGLGIILCLESPRCVCYPSISHLIALLSDWLWR